LDKYSTNVNFDEQIAAIHRAKGLGPQETSTIGPGIGTAAAPPPLATLPPPPSSLPPVPTQNSGAYAAATVSSGPQPASGFPNQPPPVMLPPLHYQGLDAAQPFGYQPPPPGAMGMHPSRLAALAGTPGMGSLPGSGSATPQTGMVRNADQMEGEDGAPPAKRQKIAKLPGGQLYPEEDWINLHPHPISLQVQLPEDNTKPEWKLDGTTVTITDLPLNLLVSTLRDRILQKTDSLVPASKIRLSYNGKMLTNSTSLASHNLEDEDLLVFSVRDAKKK
jgi:splicing factor 3A subunit 1